MQSVLLVLANVRHLQGDDNTKEFRRV